MSSVTTQAKCHKCWMCKVCRLFFVVTLMCEAATLATARAQSQHQAQHNEAMLMSRFRPRSIDSARILNEPLVQHHHKRRILTDAIADDEFVLASGTSFQVCRTTL